MRIRDRRTQKDDVILPATTEFIAALKAMKAMNPDEGMQFVIDLFQMAQNANMAGFTAGKEEDPEKRAAAVEAAIEVSVDNDVDKMLESNSEQPFIAYMVNDISKKIESCTVRYYQRSNANRENGASKGEQAESAADLSKLTSVQYAEYQRIIDGLAVHGKTVKGGQGKIIYYYAQRGGTWDKVCSIIERNPGIDIIK